MSGRARPILRDTSTPCARTQAAPGEPVSYTHLDVYKRQVDAISNYIGAHRDGARYEFVVADPSSVGDIIIRDLQPILSLTSYNQHELCLLYTSVKSDQPAECEERAEGKARLPALIRTRPREHHDPDEYPGNQRGKDRRRHGATEQ